MTEPERLPEDLLDYLDAAREPEPVPPATKDRLLARIGPLIPPGGGGGSPGGDGGAGPAPGGDPAGPAIGAESVATTAATATTSFFQGKLTVAAVSAIIGAAGGATMHATFAPPKTVLVSAAVTTASEPPPVAPVSAAAVPFVEAPAPSASVAEAPPPSPSAEVPGARKSTMRAERILLEAANAAIIRGDYTAAITSLQQHKQTYPRGELAQERDILMAQANKLKAAQKGAAPR